MDLTSYVPKSLNLFGGCGGKIKGFLDAGIVPYATVEMEHDPCMTLRMNFPGMIVVEKPIQYCVLSDYGEERLDVHTYTYPCDHFTDAGKVHGIQTGDSLYAEALREGVLLYPEIIAIENVAGMEKFPRVMQTWRSLPGYYTTEFRLSGEDFSLMRKERIILILHRQAYEFPPLEQYVPPRLGNTLRDYLDAPDQIDPFTIKPNPYYETRAGTNPEKSYRDSAYMYDPARTEPVPLFANYRRDRSTYRLIDPSAPLGHRAFSPREVARLHTFPDDYHFYGGYNSKYKQLINCVMPAMAYAIGMAIMDYFLAIPSLAPQPKHRGYRMVPGKRSVVENPLPVAAMSSSDLSQLLQPHYQQALWNV